MTIRIAHLTTIDASLFLLLRHEFGEIEEHGWHPVGIAAPGEYVTEIEAIGVEFQAVPSLGRRWSVLDDARAACELWRLLPTLNLDVLHTHTPKAGVLGRIIGRLRGVPVVVNTCHGLPYSENDRPLKRWAINAVEAIAAQFSDAELYQNPDDMLALQWATRRKAVLVGNGVDLSRFKFCRADRQRIRAELDISEKAILIGGVGRRVLEKGIREFAEAAVALEGSARFVWVGPIDRVKDDVVDEDLPGVDFLGKRSDMPAIYSALDIFVLPSHREGFPRSAMEASACGLPVVLTDIRGCRQVGSHEREVLFVPPRDVAALTSALSRLIDEEELRARLGASGRYHAERNFDHTAVASASLATYKASKRGGSIDWGS